ncbi:MAG: lysophospholipid acyltransferase family protein [Ignavibacteriales bacterium]|nr:lysophospholipid acyltransferase family protein [Ignavibacteriales bacterium]
MENKKDKKKFLRKIGFVLLPFLIDILCKTLRVNVVNKNYIDKLIEKKQNFVVAFWHGTMLYAWYYHRKNKMAALVSQSKDGELLTRVLKKWRYNIVRGSSSMGGKEAINIMVDLVKENYTIAITPDGPRGPAVEMKAGAIVTAKKGSIPLVLIGIAYRKKKILKSWDKFQIPFPFTRCAILFSEPVMIENHLTYEETDKIIKKKEKELNELTDEANRIV